MAKLGEAIEALGVSEFILRTDPTSETEFNDMFRKVTGTTDDGDAILSDDPADFGVTWSQITGKLTELNAAEPLKFLREERNRRLAETDWWVLPDRTATDEQTAYRQALRDITDTYSSLDDVVWPTKPS
jgi:hypothetical protein